MTVRLPTRIKREKRIPANISSTLCHELRPPRPVEEVYAGTRSQGKSRESLRNLRLASVAANPLWGGLGERRPLSRGNRKGAKLRGGGGAAKAAGPLTGPRPGPGW